MQGRYQVNHCSTIQMGDRPTRRSCIGWIRTNMSNESRDKIKQHMGLKEWAESEKNQNPVVLWEMIKNTHSARNTGNLHEEHLFARNVNYNIKMEPKET